jgi:hypothetical protein
MIRSSAGEHQRLIAVKLPKIIHKGTHLLFFSGECSSDN